MLVRFKLLMTFLVIFFFSSFINLPHDFEVLEGDLFFQHISMMSLYGITDKQFYQFENEIDSIISSGNARPHELMLYEHFDRLREKGLLRNPYVFLRMEPDSVMAVYLSESQYEKVKDYSLQELIKSHQKVSLKLLVEKLDERVYYSDSIISASKVYGQTYPDNEIIENL